MIILVVDNKVRDLPPLISLANILTKKYHIDVILANIYEVDDLILLYKNSINLILFSFMRDANKHRITFARLNHIKVAVYDQEGANGLDGLGVLSDIKYQKSLLRFLNAYFFWGKSQLHAASKLKKINLPSINEDVGYIRFDVDTETIKRKDLIRKNFVLVNTNFALVDPKLNTKKNEINSIKKTKLYGGKTNIFVKKMEFRRKNFLNEIEKFIQKNPKINFVLRPHPFENNKFYINFEKKYKNCFYSPHLSSLSWIKFSKLVIHIDCMTSIEAMSLNKQALSLSYLVDDIDLCYKVPYLSSIHCKNFEEANNILNKVFFKNKKFKIKDKNAYKNFFGMKKNRPTEKLAENLIKTIHSNDSREVISEKEVKTKFKNQKILSSFPLRTRVKIKLRNILSVNLFYIIYSLIVGNKIAKKYKQKCFNYNDILKYSNKNRNFKKMYANSFIFSK